MKHTGTVPLKTNRLTLRRFTMADAAVVFGHWTSDPIVARYTTWTAHESVAVTQGYLSWLTAQYQHPDFYCWGIEQNGELLGEITVVERIDPAEIAEIGYVLSQKAWNQGIMTEAYRGVLTHLFQTVGYRRIIACCDAANIGSRRVMEHVGMTHEGTLRQHLLRKDGTFGDSKLYGLLATEFTP